MGVERKLAIEPVSTSRTTPMVAMIAGIRTSMITMTLGTMREDALESLIVAEAIFDIDAANIDVGYGVGAEALDYEVLRITQRPSQ